MNSKIIPSLMKYLLNPELTYEIVCFISKLTEPKDN